MFRSLNFSQVEQQESKGILANKNITLNSTYISEPFPVQAYEDPSGPHPPEMAGVPGVHLPDWKKAGTCCRPHPHLCHCGCLLALGSLGP